MNSSHLVLHTVCEYLPKLLRKLCLQHFNLTITNLWLLQHFSWAVDYSISACCSILCTTSQGCTCLNERHVMQFLSHFSSHDFIGEFTTSYKELCRGQSQLNVYEVSADKDSRCHDQSLCLSDCYIVRHQARKWRLTGSVRSSVTGSLPLWGKLRNPVSLWHCANNDMTWKRLAGKKKVVCFHYNATKCNFLEQDSLSLIHTSSNTYSGQPPTRSDSIWQLEVWQEKGVEREDDMHQRATV